MLKITAAYPAVNGDRIVEFGPFEFVQFTYNLVRVGGPYEDFATLTDDSVWQVTPPHIPVGDDNSFSDLTVVPA